MTGMYTTANHIDLYLKPTQDTYDAFQRAYEHYNINLFDGRLPNCMITMPRRGRTLGYFSRQRFIKDGTSYCDEIALNPTYFSLRTDEETLSTLVHEMVHLWQFHFGKSGRGRYHNRQWAEAMKRIGLFPSDTGKEGGKEIGDRMSHYIMDDGAFIKSTLQLLAQGFKIEWSDDLSKLSAKTVPKTPKSPPESKTGKRVKYNCPQCGLNAWAKHEAKLICGDHKVSMKPA